MNGRNLRLGILLCLVLVTAMMPVAMAHEREPSVRRTLTPYSCYDWHYYNSTWHKENVLCPYLPKP